MRMVLCHIKFSCQASSSQGSASLGANPSHSKANPSNFPIPDWFPIILRKILITSGKTGNNNWRQAKLSFALSGIFSNFTRNLLIALPAKSRLPLKPYKTILMFKKFIRKSVFPVLIAFTSLPALHHKDMLFTDSPNESPLYGLFDNRTVYNALRSDILYFWNQPLVIREKQEALHQNLK